jgi:UDP-2,3-diacylglucosamine hydrolase
MRSYLFLSDLHLDASRPYITQLFLAFLQSEPATDSAGIYILGDLFEFWGGDDAGAYPEVIEAIKKLTDAGTAVYFMCGNRDFLVGKHFYQMTGCTQLEDPGSIDINGQSVLLMHGDTLCTDDIQYQAFRAEVRSQAWQSRALAMPLDDRLEYFQTLRESSKKSIQEKPAAIMDVNQQAVEYQMRATHTRLLIHGHTHRQNIHHFTLDGEPVTRIVLGDWYTTGNVLVLNDTDDYHFIELNTIN